MSGHHKTNANPVKDTKKQNTEVQAIEVVKTKPTAKQGSTTTTKPSEATASAKPSYKTNVNRFLPIRTSFVNEHLKDQKQFKKKKKTKLARSSGDDLIFHLFVLIILLVWLALTFGIKLLIPALPLQYCYGISAVIVLTLLVLLFIAASKKPGHA